MSRIESEFLALAIEVGLAETISRTLRDIDRSIAELPPSRLETRYRQRLEEQRMSLRQPTLRTTAALVVAMCVKTPTLTPVIHRAFQRLVEGHPELAWLFVQLPPVTPAAEPMRRFGSTLASIQLDPDLGMIAGLGFTSHQAVDASVDQTRSQVSR